MASRRSRTPAHGQAVPARQRCRTGFRIVTLAIWTMSIVAGCSCDGDSANNVAALGPESFMASPIPRYGMVYRINPLSEPEGDIEVRIRVGGIVELRSGEQWHTVTWRDLSRRIESQKERLHRRFAEEGEKATEEHLGLLLISRVRALLRIDDDAPWTHVAWVLEVIRQAPICKVDLSVGSRHVRLVLPPPSSYQEPTAPIQATVQVLANGIRSARWGTLVVDMPASVALRVTGVGEVESASRLPGVVRRIRDAAAAAGHGELDTATVTISGRVPATVAANVLYSLATALVRRLELGSVPEPPESLMQVDSLPYPKDS